MDSRAAQSDLDQAIGLYRQQRYAAARSLLHGIVSADPANATAWDVLGYLERDIGDTAAAAAAFDRALAVQPSDAIAIKGRARMALERAERDILDRYAAALATSPDDPQ